LFGLVGLDDMIKQVVAIGIILLLFFSALCGCVEITPRNDNGSSNGFNANQYSTINVRELNEHPNDYFDKTISVQGQFRNWQGHYVITEGTIIVNYVVFLEIPSSVDTSNLMLNQDYYFIGIPNYGTFTAFNEGGKRYGDHLYLRVDAIQPEHNTESGVLSVTEILTYPASYVNKHITIKGHINSDVSAIGEYTSIRIRVPANYPDVLVPNAEYELYGYLELNYDGIPIANSINKYLTFYVKNGNQGNEIYTTTINQILTDSNYFNQTIVLKAKRGSSIKMGIYLNQLTYEKHEIVDDSGDKIEAIIFPDIVNSSTLDNWQIIWFYWVGRAVKINDETFFEVAYVLSDISFVDSQSFINYNNYIIGTIQPQEETNNKNNNEEDQLQNEKEAYEAEYFEEGILSVDKLVMNYTDYLGQTVTIKTPKIRTYNNYNSAIVSDKYGSRELQIDIPDNIDTSIFPIHEVAECMWEGCLMWKDFYWTGQVVEDHEEPYGFSFFLTVVQPV